MNKGGITKMNQEKKCKVISINQLKGGVGKTTTAVNLAYALWKYHKKTVLLIDNDKQGNLSKAFGVYSPSDKYTTATLLRNESGVFASKAGCVQMTPYNGLDIVTANLDLLKANMEIMLDMSKAQHNRLKKSLFPNNDNNMNYYYDYIIIDNAPDINIGTINALAISDYVISPVVIDAYSFEGLDMILEQIQQVKEDFNPHLQFAGCLVTHYINDDVTNQGIEVLKKKYETFNQTIRMTQHKPRESTFAALPLIEYSPRCGATIDYKKFTNELLKEIENA